ncbi:hypothetical protein [Nocardia sp. CNY236]|uniref:hypothetical protein n=1 Tax=Nocardia sp. CNY236 TaxID=1169152 RepID=UPI00041F30A7|nr:hypothetical protein [Nocardia sp. CNY236]
MIVEPEPVTEFTGVRGRTVRVGDHYRDNRTSNVRDLIVTVLGVYQPPAYGGIEKPPVCSVTCSVTRTTDAGTEVMKPTMMDANRLTGRDFMLVTEGGAA